MQNSFYLKAYEAYVLQALALEPLGLLGCSPSPALHSGVGNQTESVKSFYPFGTTDLLLGGSF